MKLDGKEIAYKECKSEDILNWCEQNNQLDWLDNLANTKTERKRFKKIAKLDTDGNPVLDEKGKEVLVDDKTQPYTVEDYPTALEIRKKFFQKFFPNELPEASTKKKLTFRELVALKALQARNK